MSQYSIREIESLSGIKAHTLRIWEQRYSFISPLRTDTNIRYYSDEELKKVLNIALLNRNGYKVSKLAAMSEDDLRNAVLGLSAKGAAIDVLTDSLIQSMVDFDELRFEKVLNMAIIRSGFEETFKQLILPFLERTGILWSAGVIKPIQEHFISNLIKRKLCVAIDNLYVTRHKDSRKVLLFLPEHEWHELMLLFVDFLLRSRHHEIIYLGCSVPIADLRSVSNDLKPDYLITYITTPLLHTNVAELISEITAIFPQSKILAGGPQVMQNEMPLPLKVSIIHDAQSLLDIVQ